MNKIAGFLRRFWRELFALAGAGAVLWSMLLPGYILTLDLVWTPGRPAEWDAAGFNNAYLVLAFFHYLAAILPGWVGEKIMLFGLFFALFYLPLRFLPWIKTNTGRIFAALLYALNPFVYARMLAGQWLVLAGYALLPVLFFALAKFFKCPKRKSGFWLGLAFTLMGLFSSHFLYLAAVIFGIACAVYLIVQRKNFAKLKMVFRGALWAIGCFAILNSYWIIPAALRSAPLESRFETANFEAFAAAPNGGVPAMLNVLALGGYWGEGSGWESYFLWPQSTVIFWLAFALIAMLVIIGAYARLKNPNWRPGAIILLAAGVAGYITALGAADTLFYDFNNFLYERAPLWNGLRDSQKIAGILAFVYAVFAGIGIDRLTKALAGKARAKWPIRVLLVLPLIFGMYELGGFHGQLAPVDYPAEWYRAKKIIDAAPVDEKVLVLPWHGYFSLDFNHQLIVANPASNFFGRDRVIASKSIDAGKVRDTETNQDYRAMDTAFGSNTAPSAETLREIIREEHIGYILVINNKRQPDQGNWTDTLDANNNPLNGLKTETLASGRISLLKVLALY